MCFNLNKTNVSFWIFCGIKSRTCLKEKNQNIDTSKVGERRKVIFLKFLHKLFFYFRLHNKYYFIFNVCICNFLIK
jgi:hypothetical protein